MSNQGGGVSYLNAMAIPLEGPVFSAYPKAGFVCGFSCYGKLFSPESAMRISMGVKINRQWHTVSCIDGAQALLATDNLDMAKGE